MTPFRSHNLQSATREAEPSAIVSGVWATIKFTTLLAITGIFGWLFFQNQVQSKLCATVEEKCNTALSGTGIQTSIGSAQFFDGKGMLLSNMQAKASDISLAAYETFLSMPSNTTDLVTGNLKVEGIELRRVQLEIKRRPNQPINFDSFVRLSEAIEKATAGTEKSLIPISLIDSQIRIIDQSAGTERTISDINIRIRPVPHEGREILQVVATAAAVEVQQLVLNSFLDPGTGEWNADVRMNSAEIGTELVALLPAQIQSKMKQIEAISCRVDGSVRAAGNWKRSELRWFQGGGDVSELSLRDSRLPSEIQAGSASFQFTPDGASFSNITGQLGTSPFVANFELRGLLNPAAWRLTGRINQFNLNRSRQTLLAMPESARRFLNDFQASGKFDIQFNIGFDGNRITKNIEAQISKLAFNFNKFPYPMSECVGEAKWIDDQITYSLLHRSRDNVLSASGFINNPGKNATWKCDLKVEKGQLLFDETFQTAIDASPSMAKVVRAFNAYGWIAGQGTLEKSIPGGDVHKIFDIDVLNLTLQHDRFPYKIERVKGKINSVDKVFQFSQLTGANNNGGSILCNGTWDPRVGLDVRYQCNNIDLDKQLRSALRPELKDVWDGFRPSGTVESMTVDLKMAPGQKDASIVVHSTLNGNNRGIRTSNLSIYPTWFPYELQNLAGELAVGNGEVRLRRFTGQHGRTTVSCDGDGTYSSEGWDMRLSELRTHSLRADEQLLRALPESLARPVEYMKLDGLLNVYGTMTLAGQYRGPEVQFANVMDQSYVQPASFSKIPNASISSRIDSLAPDVSMGWDLRFDVSQAGMNLGIPLENVYGMFKLIGQYDGENVECRGSVNLESLTIYDAQITNVHGPVWFDNDRALAGGMINQFSSDQSNSPSIEGEMYGGIVKLDAAISSDAEGRFAIQTSVADGDLRQFVNEYSPGAEEVEGRTFAALRMQGDASGTHTCRGSGEIYLRDAKIYELPPVMKLLNLFNIRRVSDVAFDSGDIFFAVNGENIDINRIEFNGDAISIIGNGRMNMDHQLDLNFYSVMGRNRLNIPLITDLYQRSSQKFMWINVGGTCQDPKVSTEILPELNDSLRQLSGQGLR